MARRSGSISEKPETSLRTNGYGWSPQGLAQETKFNRNGCHRYSTQCNSTRCLRQCELTSSATQPMQ
eukprot:1259455-Pyramimonas_sp.AAC.1